MFNFYISKLNEKTEIDRVKDLLDQKIAELNQAIKLRREVGFEAAQEVVNSDLGKDLMGEIREGMEKLRQEELRLLEERSLAPDEAIRNTKKALYTVLIFDLIVITSLSFLFLKSINSPIRQFRKAIKVITDGDRHLRVKRISNDELGQVSDAFNQMLENLERTTVSNEELQKEIKDRIAYQRTLKIRDENLKKFFKNVHMGILLKDIDGNFIETNPEFERITGYSNDELINMSYWDITPKVYKKQEEIKLKSIATTGKYGPYKKQYRNKNGDLVPVLLNGVKTTDELGNHYIWSVVQDITEEEAYKDKLEHDVKKLKLLLETGKLISFEVDLSTGKISTIRDKISIDDTNFPIRELESFDDFFEVIHKKHRKSCEKRNR